MHTGIPTQCVLDERTRRGKDWVKLMDTAVVRNLIASMQERERERGRGRREKREW